MFGNSSNIEIWNNLQITTTKHLDKTLQKIIFLKTAMLGFQNYDFLFLTSSQVGLTASLALAGVKVITPSSYKKTERHRLTQKKWPIVRNKFICKHRSHFSPRPVMKSAEVMNGHFCHFREFTYGGCRQTLTLFMLGENRKENDTFLLRKSQIRLEFPWAITLIL